ncbi:hypothetical protein DI005_11440 [Prauserella sp. PE36]|uniref:hypothetical protein n=1 Tax=Prauserella sp. PE36 TaxID=1504709 RepID=UPI000DE294A9|nr:hypothetical protein [Prauserella sp. PE36]RBM20959.1 hypothetical protein DI005_11440 [Prauserella sp. PE36]
MRLAEPAHLPFASVGYDAAPEIYRRIDELVSGFGVRRRMVVEGHNLCGLAHVVATEQAFTLIGVEAASPPSPCVVPTGRSRPCVWCWRAEPPGVVADLVAVVRGFDRV